MTSEDRAPVAPGPPASSQRSSFGFTVGLFIAGVVITAAFLALGGGGNAPSRKPPPPPAKLPKLTEQFNDRLLGVTGLTTRRWVVGGRGAFLHLVSTDRKAIIAIATPGPARTAHGALHVAIATVRQQYKHVTLKQAPGSTLGGRPAFSVVMYGTNARGVRLRILLASAAGRKLAYVMQVFTALDAPLQDLEEAQETVATLRFNN